MKKIILLLLQLCIFYNWGIGQTIPGKILLVGGGSESAGGWSDEPYSWAIEESENKRVAIIGVNSDVSNWLPNYFEETCDAIYARNFIVPNQTVANLQSLYDSLITYDVIFFRGGDQYDYYGGYKNTLLQDAVNEVFASGGVIAGTSAGLHILSGVVFTARYGTVYPEEAIEDPYNQYMTLSNDFFSFLPEMIFESHTAERARFARVIGFMGRWQLDGNQAPLGIAVDDKTAFCINSDLVGKAFGTGSVGIYHAGDNNNFRLSEQKLIADNLQVSQLIHGTEINLNTLVVTGFDEIIENDSNESYGIPLWLSGSDNLSDNEQLIVDFCNYQSDFDSIVLITNQQNSEVSNLIARFVNHGSFVSVVEANPTNGNSAAINRIFTHWKKLVFYQNDYLGLLDYLQGTPNGLLLSDLIFNGQKNIAMIGGDSRFAGKSLILNYDQEYASYDGLLNVKEGLGFLQQMIVMPNTFAQSIDNENAATGVPYVMISEKLGYGLWLSEGNYARLLPADQKYELVVAGNFPGILAINNHTKGKLTDQSAVSSGLPRNIAGFSLLSYKLLDESSPYLIDLTNSINDINFQQKLLYPNPASEFIQINEALTGKAYKIIDSSGKIRSSGIIASGGIIEVSFLPVGYYILVVNSKINSVTTFKFNVL